MSTRQLISRNRPLISAIVCTYNRAGLLGRALGALCGQTLDAEQFEVIVVDDGSTDETRLVVQRFEGIAPLRYVYQANSGEPAWPLKKQLTTIKWSGSSRL